MIEKKFEIIVKEFDSLSELSDQEVTLIDAAKEASSDAYAPYSGFMVGAAAITGSGVIVRGNNRENAAFPSGSCAERTVLSYLGANYPDERIVAIAICASKEGLFIEEPVSPCGSCRQLISEEEERTGYGIKIILYGEKKIQVINGISSLLPLQFNRRSLKG